MSRTLIAGPYTFTGTDGTNVSADTTNWTEQDGVSGQLRLKSNGFQQAFGAPSDDCWKGAGTFTGDQYFEVKLLGSWATSDQDGIGGTLRNDGTASTSHNCYRVFWQPSLNSTAGAAQVYKVVAGTPTQIGANINFGMTASDLLSAEAVTNGANVDIIVYKNGVSQGTRSDTSSVLTGGKPGITGKGSSYVLIGDDWTAGNVTAAAAGGFLNRNFWWGNY